MAVIGRITRRSAGGCSGVCLGEVFITATIGGGEREFRLMRSPLDGVWRLQALRPGARGESAADFEEAGDYASSDEAIAAIERLPG